MSAWASLFQGLLLVVLLLPTEVSAQDHCSGYTFWLSHKTIESKRTLPDGTEWHQSERVIGLCVDPAVKNEIVATIKHGREVSESALADIRNAIRSGAAGVRVISDGIVDVSSETLAKTRSVTAITSDMTAEALWHLASGARWVWRAYAATDVTRESEAGCCEAEAGREERLSGAR